MLFCSELLFLSCICGLFYVGLRKTETQNIYFFGGGVVILLDVLFNIMLYCYWDDFLLGVSIVKLASIFLSHTKRILYVSFFQFCIALLALYLWVLGFSFSLSLGIIEWKQEVMSDYPDLNPNTEYMYSRMFTLLIVF